MLRTSSRSCERIPRCGSARSFRSICRPKILDLKVAQRCRVSKDAHLLDQLRPVAGQIGLACRADRQRIMPPSQTAVSRLSPVVVFVGLGNRIVAGTVDDQLALLQDFVNRTGEVWR